jgi:tripartite-type tricarboxylate transporter receptor subunit TctC
MPLILGFPMALPPGTPADRVAMLRAAYKAAIQDPELKADSAKAHMEYSPKLGEQVTQDILNMSKTPPSVIERYKKAIASE